MTDVRSKYNLKTKSFRRDANENKTGLKPVSRPVDQKRAGIVNQIQRTK